MNEGAARRWGYYGDLITTLTLKEIKVRYKRTFLGYAWSLLNPVVYAVAYWIAFKAILNVKIDGYLIFLLAGLFPWQWLNNSLGLAPGTFLANAPLLKKIAFPRALIVASSVATEGLHFLMCLPVLAVVIVASGRGAPAWPWLWGIPLLFVLQALVVYGIALAVASCNVFFRDIERLLVLALTVLFFLTPVIYEQQMIPPLFQPALSLNPFAPLIVGWRTLLLHGILDWNAVQAAAWWGLAAVAVGHAVFHRLQWKFAEAL